MQETQRTAQDRRRTRVSGNARSGQRKGNAHNQAPRRGRPNNRQFKQGYSLQKHPINFSGRRGRLRKLDPLGIILFGIAVIIVIVLVFSLVSCVGSCSSKDTSQTEPVVAEGLSDSLTNSLKARLTQDDQLKQIAANATDYPEALITLALNEPSAVSFVYAYPTATKEATAGYTGSLTAGSAPTLYTFNSNWGYATYADQPLALTGSGPLTLAMAYMGLTGTADKTPGDFATLATDGNYASGDAYTTEEYFTATASSLGLTATAIDLSDAAKAAESLTTAITDGSFVAVEVTGDTFGSARWILVTGNNSDGSVVVHDPLSTENTAHPWDPATVIANAKSAVTLSLQSSNTANATTADASTTSDSSTTTS